MAHLNWIVVLTFVLSTDASMWGYEGGAGPIHWRDLFPEACSGRYQSPIDIVPEESIYDPKLRDLAIFYDPPRPGSKFYLHNNGHAVQVDTMGEFYVSNGGLPNIYRTTQFHFHWGHKSHHGSEHTVNGKAAPLEMHIVSWNVDRFTSIVEAATEPQGLAVLGILFQVSDYDNPALEPMVQIMMDIRDPDEKIRAELPAASMRDFLPSKPWKYFRYDGSLTTPGCFESVIWTVFREKQTISKRQLRVFRQVLKSKHHKRHLNKRSLRREQTMVRGVMEEIGIQDNVIEKSRFRRNLEGKLAADVSSQPVEEIPMEEMSNKMAKNESAVIQDGGQGHTDGATEYVSKDGGHAATNVSVAIVKDTIRHMLVNNFRPVQPLNGRVVYRSFPSLYEPDMGPRNGPVYQSRQDPVSGSTVIAHSAFLAIVCLLFAFIH